MDIISILYIYIYKYSISNLDGKNKEAKMLPSSSFQGLFQISTPLNSEMSKFED